MRTRFAYLLSVRSDTAADRWHAAPTMLPLTDHKILPEQGDPGISSNDPLEMTPASPGCPTRSCTMTLIYHTLPNHIHVQRVFSEALSHSQGRPVTST